mmetsp:Transcript_6882/g.12083  ORF Transcript_6882/g.12083 Transcript_6882/m.12083 type:complete len:173 (-) Transcript_6882:532-1050(-)
MPRGPAKVQAHPVCTTQTQAFAVSLRLRRVQYGTLLCLRMAMAFSEPQKSKNNDNNSSNKNNHDGQGGLRRLPKAEPGPAGGPGLDRVLPKGASTARSRSRSSAAASSSSFPSEWNLSGLCFARRSFARSRVRWFLCWFLCVSACWFLRTCSHHRGALEPDTGLTWQHLPHR